MAAMAKQGANAVDWNEFDEIEKALRDLGPNQEAVGHAAKVIHFGFERRRQMHAKEFDRRHKNGYQRFHQSRSPSPVNHRSRSNSPRRQTRHETSAASNSSVSRHGRSAMASAAENTEVRNVTTAPAGAQRKSHDEHVRFATGDGRNSKQPQPPRTAAGTSRPRPNSKAHARRVVPKPARSGKVAMGPKTPLRATGRPSTSAASGRRRFPSTDCQQTVSVNRFPSTDCQQTVSVNRFPSTDPGGDVGTAVTNDKDNGASHNGMSVSQQHAHRDRDRPSTTTGSPRRPLTSREWAGLRPGTVNDGTVSGSQTDRRFAAYNALTTLVTPRWQRPFIDRRQVDALVSDARARDQFGNCVSQSVAAVEETIRTNASKDTVEGVFSTFMTTASKRQRIRVPGKVRRMAQASREKEAAKVEKLAALAAEQAAAEAAAKGETEQPAAQQSQAAPQQQADGDGSDTKGGTFLTETNIAGIAGGDASSVSAVTATTGKPPVVPKLPLGNLLDGASGIGKGDVKAVSTTEVIVNDGPMSPGIVVKKGRDSTELTLSERVLLKPFINDVTGEIQPLSDELLRGQRSDVLEALERRTTIDLRKLQSEIALLGRQCQTARTTGLSGRTDRAFAGLSARDFVRHNVEIAGCGVASVKALKGLNNVVTRAVRDEAVLQRNFAKRLRDFENNTARILKIQEQVERHEQSKIAARAAREHSRYQQRQRMWLACVILGHRSSAWVQTLRRDRAHFKATGEHRHGSNDPIVASKDNVESNLKDGSQGAIAAIASSGVASAPSAGAPPSSTRTDPGESPHGGDSSESHSRRTYSGSGSDGHSDESDSDVDGQHYGADGDAFDDADGGQYRDEIYGDSGSSQGGDGSDSDRGSDHHYLDDDGDDDDGDDDEALTGIYAKGFHFD